MRRELVDAVEAAGVPLGATAFELAVHGFRDPRVAEALQGQADEALPTEPVEAWRLYAASIEAGGDVAALAGRRAQAAWAAGDIRAAERLVDGLLTGTDHPDLPRVMNVAAAIWARKGMLRRAPTRMSASPRRKGARQHRSRPRAWPCSERSSGPGPSSPPLPTSSIRPRPRWRSR